MELIHFCQSKLLCWWCTITGVLNYNFVVFSLWWVAYYNALCYLWSNFGLFSLGIYTGVPLLNTLRCCMLGLWPCQSSYCVVSVAFVGALFCEVCGCHDVLSVPITCSEDVHCSTCILPHPVGFDSSFLPHHFVETCKAPWFDDLRS